MDIGTQLQVFKGINLHRDSLKRLAINVVDGEKGNNGELKGGEISLGLICPVCMMNTLLRREIEMPAADNKCSDVYYSEFCDGGMLRNGNVCRYNKRDGCLPSYKETFNYIGS